MKLYIHYTPGARGDFLASILLGVWEEVSTGALLIEQSDYYKIHYLSTPLKPLPIHLDFLKIKILDNNLIDSIMQITFSHIVKNPTPPELSTMGLAEYFYYTTTDWLKRNQQDLLIPQNYDYYIDFQELSDIEFISDFYFRQLKKPIDPDLKIKIFNNINAQRHWTEDKDLVVLSKLIDYENRNRLFGCWKSFTLTEFINHSNPESLLKFKHYSKTENW